MAKATKGVATQSLTNNTFTFVTWDTEEYDTDTMFTTGSPTLMTCVTPGIYLVTATLVFATNATGARLLLLMKNPSSASDTTANFAGNWAMASTAENVLSVSCPISLAATDVIRCSALQQSGGALNIGAVPSYSQQNHFAVTLLGRTS